jgi:hypothetical protein
MKMAKKLRRSVAVLLTAVAVPTASHAQTNSWISPTRGFWDDYTKWSLEIAPANTHSVYITNAPTKTVTIDSITSGDYPDSMTISDLTISAPDPSTNTLSLTDAGLAVPLQVMNGCSVSNGSALIVDNSAMIVQAGLLSVNGALILTSGWLAANSGMQVGFSGAGTVTLVGGTLTTSSLQANTSATVNFFGGLLQTADTSLSGLLTVGDGTHAATLQLLGGSHSFGNGLTISSNAQLTGCGTISGSIVNHGLVLSDCAGGTLTFSGVVTNNATIIATNGAGLSFGAVVVNDGTIDASAGSVWFWSGAVNNGTILPMAPPAAPSSLEARTVYPDLAHVYLTWQDNATNETGFALERSTNGTAFIQIATLPADSTTFIDAPLSNLTTLITYRVLATNSVGYSAYSDIATASMWTATNSWISSGDGAWQDATNWSLVQSPTNVHSILITNDNTKTVTIDGTTSGSFSNTMTVSDVILSAPGGATNILDLSNAGTNTALRVLHRFSITDGGLLRLTNSVLSVDSLVDGGFSVDGSLVLNGNSLLGADGGLYVGLDTNGMGSVLLAGGQILMTNQQPSAIGVNGPGQMILSNGAVLNPSVGNFLFAGSGSGSQGTLTVAGGNYTTRGRLVAGMEAAATGTVSVTGGQLGVTNMLITLIGGDGSGQLNLSGGTNTLGPTEIGGNPGSQGTMTVAGGVNYLQGALFVGASPGATGTVWVTGGQLIATNPYWLYRGGATYVTNYWPTYVGACGVGTITMSNGNWLVGPMIVGADSNSQGAVTLAGGNMFVTNAAHNAVIEVRRGAFTVSGGTLVADRLVANSPWSHFLYTGGTLLVSNLFLNSAVSATGDGLPDLWKQTYGLDPLSSSGDNGPDGDPDSDGVPNLQEYLDGTDPTNATSALRITSITQEGDDMRVTWTTVGGKTYLLQGTTSNVFVDLATIVMPDGGESTTNYLDIGAATNTPPRSYRVQLVPPTGLWVGFCQATAVPFNQIAVGWSDDNNNEDGYKIERATSASGPWTQIAQVLANTGSYRDTGLFPNTVYYYRVRAYNSEGDSRYSNAASASPPALCPTSVIDWGQGDGWPPPPAVPTNLTGVVAISGGYQYGLALKSDGTVVGLGVTPPANWTGVVAIAAGNCYGWALKSDGTIVNLMGVPMPENWTGVVAIAVGWCHALGLKSDGTVLGWGNDTYGQATPPTNLTGVVAIAAGGSHSLALKSDGTVVGWGFNSYGQASPPTSLYGVVAIAAGGYHSLALKSDGTVVGWGDNNYGQASPPTNLTGVVAIAAGEYYHSLALKSDGTAVAWGWIPPTNLTGVVAIAAGTAASPFYEGFGLALTLVPNAPSALTATAVSWNKVNLSWTDNSSNETRFEIERSTWPYGGWSEIASVNSNVTAYSDTGVTCGQTNYYRVRACNACAASPYSYGSASANTSTVDGDCDGIPNSWMLQYFGHPTGQASDHSRAADDADGDGLANLQEYLAGTDPTNSTSAFRITSILPEGNDLRIAWSAVTNKTYAVQVATNSLDGSFTNAFGDLGTVAVPAAPAITETNYLDVGALTNDWSRFYRIRLVTPP